MINKPEQKENEKKQETENETKNRLRVKFPVDQNPKNSHKIMCESLCAVVRISNLNIVKKALKSI